MDTLSFIGHCIGAAPATCEFIDRIEDDFKMYEWGFDLEETLLITLIQQSIKDHKHCTTGNMLIQYYYNEIIKHYLDAYDELSEDLFRTWVNGNDSNSRLTAKPFIIKIILKKNSRVENNA